MNHFIHGVVRAISETFDVPEPILEIGSYQVEGQEPIANVRRLFADSNISASTCGPAPASIALPMSRSCRRRRRRSARCWR